MNAQAAALQFVKQHFSDCRLALLAGSVARNEQTSTSDLDIVIVLPELSSPYKESFFEHGWPIETFVHTEASILAWIDKNRLQRKCSMASMLRDGWYVTGDSALHQELRQRAINFISAGPARLSEAEDADERYSITEYLDDFIGATQREQKIFVLSELMGHFINYLLSKEGHWRSSGKFLPRAMAGLTGDFGAQAMAAMEQFYRFDDSRPLIKLISATLEKHGGRHFAGHSQGKP